jgi:hypothetical protein
MLFVHFDGACSLPLPRTLPLGSTFDWRRHPRVISRRSASFGAVTELCAISVPSSESATAASSDENRHAATELDAYGRETLEGLALDGERYPHASADAERCKPFLAAGASKLM